MRKWNGYVSLLLAVLIGLVLTAAAPAGPVRADTPAREVVLLEASGAVIPPLASYIARGIEEADSRNAEAVILILNTPGGAVNVTFEIIQAIRNSDVPVIVYVGPPGSKAASAGLLIVLAGHAAAMAPDTAIGASSPIDASGSDLPSTAQQKAEEFISAEARALASRRGEAAVQLANDAVVDARAASFQEAAEAGLVDFIATDVDDLLDKLNGFQVEVQGRARVLNTQDAALFPIEMTLLESILLIVTDPNIVSLLLAIGPLLIIIEIRTPGGWVAGALGAICTGLALYGLGVLPVNWLGMVFVVLAVVLFVLEVTTPTTGVLSAAAVASLVVGAVILFNTPEIAPFGRLSIPLLIAQSLLLGGLFAFFAVMVVRAQRLKVTTGYEGLIGQVGRVTKALDPVGTVLVWGERWQAEAEERQHVPEDTEVEVTAAHGLRLVVRPHRTGKGAED
ncbi:MAG: nodulation protein NfeD [Anaerolineae bacterium]